MKKFPNDSDAAIEGQLLREALRARLAPLPTGGQGNACLDPETLAAWADDGLDARERAAAEAHAADCSRCQALLAAMIRTAEPAADAAPWWRLPAMKWLVPLSVDRCTPPPGMIRQRLLESTDTMSKLVPSRRRTRPNAS